MKKVSEIKLKTGWIPDYQDIRDYTPDSPKFLNLTQNINLEPKGAAVLPARVDLRAFCGPVEDQQTIGSCTAHAGAGLVEYFENITFNKHTEASRLFLYKVTRNLMRQTGDTGAQLRTTMGALVLFGTPPEEFWQYDINNFDEEPPAFCYSFAQNYQTLQYIRLDPLNTPKDVLLGSIKNYIAAKFAIVFGFTVYSSIRYSAANNGAIPFPCSKESVEGGHAIMAVGYDDDYEIKNPISGDITKGAFLIKNSWGTEWGECGFGWLPYQYVLSGLAQDWWTILKKEWIETDIFGI